MPHLRFGNESVVEHVKADEGKTASEPTSRKDLGTQVTLMNLNEVDGEDRPSRAMNLAKAIFFWDRHSDKAPAWVDGDDDLLVQLVADQLGCEIGQPENWQHGE